CAIGIDWEAPGIQNVATLTPWVAVYDINFLTALMIDVAVKHGRSEQRGELIKSWTYFRREISAHFQQNAQSVRRDPDGIWQRKAAELRRRHQASTEVTHR